MTSQLDLALSYTSQNWPVFPCRHADEDTDRFDPETGEFEVLKAKSPLTSNGLRAATCNERITRELWRRHPAAMIGIPTGEKTGVWVLDIDRKTLDDGSVINGFEWLEAMEDEHGQLPDTAMVTTPRGGRHYYFVHIDGIKNRGGIGAGVDVRGEGGFVIAAGSEMGDGRVYEWLDHAEVELPVFAEAPQWLLDLVLPPKRERPAATMSDYSYQQRDVAPYVNAAIEAEMNRLASTGQGGRGQQLNASAFSMGQLVGANVLSRDAAESELYSAAQANGLLVTDGEREVLAKIRRGLDAGEREPRQIPERDQDNTHLVDVTRMIENGLRKAREAAAMPALDTVREQVKPAAADAPEQVQEPAPAMAVVATPFDWVDPTKIARRSFVFGTHYIRKYVASTVAPGGLGKTSNTIAEVLSMVSGRQLLSGMKPPSPLRVWMFNAEDPRDELERRIMAACLHYDLAPDDINGRLFLDTGREQELVVAREDKRAGVKINEPVVEAVVAQILANQIDVMIVDPFVSTHAVNENDNGAIDKVAKLWAHIADRTNCAIDIVHHLRKVADREATVEDARGAVALIGAARSVRVLNRMTEQQAQDAGMAVNDRFGYFSVTYGKSNLTPLNHQAHWRHLVSQGLGNGGEGNLAMLNQDNAPVVTSWQWPDAEQIVEAVTQDQMRQICSMVDNAEYKIGNRAKNWVGVAVAFALGLDLEDEAAKRRVAGLVKAMLSEGTLVKSQERDAVRREAAEFVRSAGYARAMRA